MKKLLALCAAVAVAACYSWVPINAGEPSASATSPTAPAIVLTAPAAATAVELLKPEQLAFLRMPRAERIDFFADPAKRQVLALSAGHPLAVEFAWKAVSPSMEYTLWYARNPDFRDAMKITTQETRASIDNLRIATTYHWKVMTKNATSAVQNFTTATTAPRLLRIPGVDNARDLGGRIGLNGRRVRQDRIFRTAQFNDVAKPVFMNIKELEQDPDYAEEMRTARICEDGLKEITAGKAQPVPYAIGRKWTAFQPNRKQLTPEECRTVAGLNTVPETLFGATASIFMADTQDLCRLPYTGNGEPMVLFQEFTSERDGMMPIRCGGDWYWRLMINGMTICNRLTIGNKKAVDANAHWLLLPVCRGRNIVSVILRSGSGGCLWGCGALTGVNPDELAKTLAAQRAEYLPMRQHVLKMYTPGKCILPPETLRYMRETLGIKTDLDLRSIPECGGMTASPLGEGVKWVHIPSFDYENMQTANGKKAFAESFRLLLDEKNYPIVFHCVHGRSRTGSLAFILNGLLGVDEDELYRDWEATAFCTPSVKFSHARRFNGLITGFMKVPGTNMNDRIANYVLACGFTQEDINRFREMMLEPLP